MFASELPAGAGRDASAFVRALLSWACGTVWGIPCPAVTKTEKGKPYFPDAPGRFLSLSHGRTHVLAALSEAEVGADLETVRPVDEKLRERLFTPEERRDFSFFEAWTLRESVYKLTGEGSLTDLRLSRAGGEIATPFPGVRCRLYRDVPGCAAAAACREGSFPEKIEIVPAAAFWPCKTE